VIREALPLERLLAMDAREAAAWLVVRREEGFSQSEQGLLEAWLAADAAHARELDRVDRVWGLFADADDHELLGAMRAHAVRPAPRRRMNWTPAAAAAALLLLLGAGLLLFLTPGRQAPVAGGGGATAQAVQYVSAVGQVRQIALPDGSRMMLDARSVAIGRFEAGRRSVELVRGRAFFDIAPDEARPFSVTAADRQVVAAGTRFDVNLSDGALIVNLIEGAVTVGPAGKEVRPVRLRPGQRFVEQGGKAVIRDLGSQIG
jgi:transmembrane sensor